MAVILIIPLITLAVCIHLGCYSWVLAVLGVSLSACLLLQKRIGIKPATNLANSIWLSIGGCLGHALAILVNEDFARVIPAAFILSTFLMGGFSNLRDACHFTKLRILPLFIFGILIADRDMGCLVLTLSVLLVLGGHPVRLLSSRVNRTTVGIALLVIAVVSNFATVDHRSGKTGIIQAGEWAKSVEEGNFPENLNQQLSYSYSGFRDLVRGEIIELDANDFDEFAELWLITPTKPLSAQVVGKIEQWIRRGGHLVVVCDHTDLFGHAKVANALLERFSVKTSTSALFKPGATAFSADTLDLATIPVKTSSTVSGLFSMPLWSARQVEEREDYSTPNFFGPLSESVDDKFGRKAVGLRKSVGRGFLTVHGDSTVFANFCVYQPGVPELIQKLRSVNATDRLWPYLSVSYLLVTLFCFTFIGGTSALFIYSIVCLSLVLPNSCEPLNWSNFVWVTGNKELVMENGDPKSHLSTAYSLLGLSGTKPRWADAPENSIKNGIFFGNGEAPPGWKSVTSNSSTNETEKGFNEWEPLYYHLGISPVIAAKNEYTDKILNAGGLFTDDVMGNWWFDRGVSLKRMERFSAWLKWATGRVIRPQMADTKQDLWRSDQLQDYWLILFSGEELPVRLPMILNPKNGMQIYLGRGLSAEVVIENGQLSILGAASWTESWSAPFNWVLVPKQK